MRRIERMREQLQQLQQQMHFGGPPVEPLVAQPQHSSGSPRSLSSPRVLADAERGRTRLRQFVCELESICQADDHCQRRGVSEARPERSCALRSAWAASYALDSAGRAALHTSLDSSPADP
jgi:hypothetical protein